MTDITSGGNALIADLAVARARIDQTTVLLEQAQGLRELLRMGVLDIDDAADEVRAFRGACRRWRLTND